MFNVCTVYSSSPVYKHNTTQHNTTQTQHVEEMEHCCYDVLAMIVKIGGLNLADVQSLSATCKELRERVVSNNMHLAKIAIQPIGRYVSAYFNTYLPDSFIVGCRPSFTVPQCGYYSGFHGAISNGLAGRDARTSTGFIRLTGQFKWGNPHGTWKSYIHKRRKQLSSPIPPPVLLDEESYDYEGKLHGYQEIRHGNGKMKSRIHFVHGKICCSKNGEPARVWHGGGTLSEECMIFCGVCDDCKERKKKEEEEGTITTTFYRPRGPILYDHCVYRTSWYKDGQLESHEWIHQKQKVKISFGKKDDKQEEDELEDSSNLFQLEIVFDTIHGVKRIKHHHTL